MITGIGSAHEAGLQVCRSSPLDLRTNPGSWMGGVLARVRDIDHIGSAHDDAWAEGLTRSQGTVWPPCRTNSASA
jgi:hypothetical protein